MSRILMIAAEASSAQYAEQLMKHWSSQGKTHQLWGVGSKSMEQLGFQCIGYAENMAVMGFSEVLKHYSDIKAVYNKVLEEVKKNKPQVAVLMDYPGFNLRLSKDLHELGVPVIYYISPQIWAWKKNRIHTVKAYVSLMLVVFPFEVDFYKSHKVRALYVGHPLLDEIKPEYFDKSHVALRLGKLGINPETHKVLGLMPGSRQQEIDRHLEIQIQVSEELVKKDPNIKVLLLVAPTISKEMIQSRLEKLNYPLILVQDNPFSMISLVDTVLVASGTATLMVGLLEKPMVIMYKASWISAKIGRWLYKGFFGLVNLLSKKEIVPEIFQSQATKEILTPLVHRAIYDLDYRAQVIRDLKTLNQQLGDKGITGRVADAIDEFLDDKNLSEGLGKNGLQKKELLEKELQKDKQ